MFAMQLCQVPKHALVFMQPIICAFLLKVAKIDSWNNSELIIANVKIIFTVLYQSYAAMWLIVLIGENKLAGGWFEAKLCL